MERREEHTPPVRVCMWARKREREREAVLSIPTKDDYQSINQHTIQTNTPLNTRPH